MYKKIRKSVADAIATVEDPEQFCWNRWLKEPQIYLERFPKPRIITKKIESFNTFPESTLFQVKNFKLTKFKISEDIKNIIIKKRKTFKVFVTFPKTYHQKITIFSSDTTRQIFLISFFYKDSDFFVLVKQDDKETVNSLLPKTSLKTIPSVKASVKKYKTDLQKVKYYTLDCLVTKPELKNYEFSLPSVNKQEKISLPSNLKLEKIKNINVLKHNGNKKYLAISFDRLEKEPKIKNIPILTLEKLKEQLEKSGSKKVFAFATNVLNEKPKQYKVKLIQLEKSRIQLYHLKNLHTKAAQMKPIKFHFLEKPSVNIVNSFKEQLFQTKVSNPGILDLLIPQEIVKPKKKPRAVKLRKETDSTQLQEVTLNVRQQFNSKTISNNLLPTEEQKKVDSRQTILQEAIEQIKNLSSYQKEGINLLLNSKAALLSDEVGIDKKSQAIHALNLVIKEDIIKNVLIICPNAHVGNKAICEDIENVNGWINQIHKLYPDLQIELIESAEGNKPEISAKTKISIGSYNTLIELLNDSTKTEFYKSIECVILDEAQYLLNPQFDSELLFDFPQYKYQWVLTSLPSQITEERLIPKLKNHLVGLEKFDGTLNRTKHSLGSELPSIVRNDFWHNLDLEQSQEFENTLLQGKKRIQDLVKGGNPFIIQSNIFTLIHQIKQLGNFSTHKETSPKSELLLDQLETIIASGQKCIIFSQYDKQGIQKIERLLKNNQIRYVLYQSGMPLKELENSTNSFRRDPKISVMLAGLTAASIKVKIPEASYLIHFDQWWNPITQWQFEDKSINSDEINQYADSVNVINYFGNNSVEINIRKTLLNKGLLTKNLIEFLPSEMVYSLITNEDWLDILGIEYTRSIKSQLPDVEEIINNLSKATLDEIGQKAKSLFTKLGYKNLMIKPDMLHEELTIYGIANKALQEIKTAIFCLPFKAKNVEAIETFIKEASKNNSRLFIICSDEIIQQVINDPHEKIIYVSQKMFANYLTQFKIS